jgi:hypothetical protein
MPSIVQVNVTQQVAPTPETLQETGAFISQGATNLADGTFALLTQLSDLTSLLTGALALSSLTWSGSVVTATTAAPHGYTTSDVIELTIAGATPSGYNGTFACTITGASTFTYPLASNPGSETVPGTYTPEDVAELVAMATTFFAQGSQQAVYVLELGAGTPAEGVTALSAYITANPNSSYTSGATGYFYSYLVPRAWSGESTFITFANTLVAATAKTYFFVTGTTGNYTTWEGIKSVNLMVEAPGIPATEFSHAADFWVTLHYAPTATNKVAPLAFAFVFGVTPYPTRGNGALLTAFKTNGVNYIGTGAEGGISETIVLWGTTMDKRPFTYWYSVDWIQINTDLDISNAVINGSNNPANPLYLNQDGINRLQDVGAATLSSAVTFGLALGTVTQTELVPTDFATALESGQFNGQLVINAVPFVTYYTASPSDYRNGVYGGFSVVYVTQNGFVQIIFNISVTDFAVA